MSAPPDWLKKSSKAAKIAFAAPKATKSPVPSAPAGEPQEISDVPKLAKPLIMPPPQGPVSVKYHQAYEQQKNAPSVVKTKLTGSEAALLELVKTEIATSPFAHSEDLWAARPMAWYAERLGVTERQINRLSRSIPLIWRRVKVTDKNLTLFRDGDPAEKTSYDFAQMMAKDFNDFTGRRTSRKDFGNLLYFAKELNEFAPDVFLTILNDWGGFMAAAKIAVTVGMSGGDSYCKDPDEFYYLYLEYPATGVIRRFHEAAWEYYEQRLKEKTDWEKTQKKAKLG